MRIMNIMSFIFVFLTYQSLIAGQLTQFNAQFTNMMDATLEIQFKNNASDTCSIRPASSASMAHVDKCVNFYLVYFILKKRNDQKPLTFETVPCDEEGKMGPFYVFHQDSWLFEQNGSSYTYKIEYRSPQEFLE